MAIYTKKGDKGETDLFDLKTGEKIRVEKDNLRLEVIGSIDELNSCLGIVKSLYIDSKDKEFIEKIQKDLFLMNSVVAGVKNLKFPMSEVSYLEKKIDLLEKKLPSLKNFILPGQGLLSSHLHLSRSITRRAERALVSLAKGSDVKSSLLIFLNRLSDFLFVLVRYENFKKGKKELYWSN